MTTNNAPALDLYSVYCGGAVQLQTADWRQDGTQQDFSYYCPYCQRGNGFALPARLLWVAKRPVPVSEQ